MLLTVEDKEDFGLSLMRLLLVSTGTPFSLKSTFSTFIFD